MSRVVFVFDRVMHYHRDTLNALQSRLLACGVEFHLLSSQDQPGAKGRVADGGRLGDWHRFYRLSEYQLGGFTLRMQHGLAALVRQIRPDVIVSMAHSGALSEWWLHAYAAKTGARTVAWQCGYEYNPGRLKRWVLARFVPRFSFHLCYHSNARQYALRHGARPEQTLVMHNTINEGKIVAGDRAAAREQLLAKHPQLAGAKIVLYVGAVLEEKNLDKVFTALTLLSDVALKFVIVGDGPYLETLRSRYAGRGDWLAVGKVIDGVGGYFDAADVFVLPGTGGLAINEAMAHRLPVISGYADGSADDLVVDGQTGFRIDGESAEQLADKLRVLFAEPARAAAMGVAGEQRIRGELSFARFIDRVMGVLQRMQAAR